MIYLVCHSGYLNYGDELISKTWIDQLTQAFPLEKIWVDTCNPGVSSVLFSDYPNVSFTDTLWTASRNSIGKDIDHILNLSFIRDGGSGFANGLELIKTARIVHLVGGGYMNSEIYFNYAIIATLGYIKKKHNIDIIGTGLGLEPVAENLDHLMKEYFKCFSWIDVRDQESYDRLLRWGLGERASFTCDDVFLTTPSEPPLDRDGKLIISAQTGANPHIVISFLLKLIENCPQAKNGVEFLVLDADSDIVVAEKLRNISNRTDIIIRDFGEIWSNGLRISPKDFVFSTRFHAHLVTSTAGARGLCASVSIPYYDVKHLSLIKMGSGFTIVGMHDFSFVHDWHAEDQTFKDCALELQNRKLEIVKKLYVTKQWHATSNDNVPIAEFDSELTV